MEPRVRESFHTAEKQRVCPRCEARDSIQFWEAGPAQRDLLGNVTREDVKLDRPRCRRCGETFPRMTQFMEAR